MGHSKPTHPYHLVNPSPWPIVGALSLLLTASGAVLHMHGVNVTLIGTYKIHVGTLTLIAGFVMILYTMFVWWRDVIREGIRDKAHNNAVRTGLRIGMALFILSEVMFFFAFFFSFFSVSQFPVHILDGVWPVAEGVWPPKDIKPFDPWELPFLNTLILLLSGTTVTWAHHALLENKREDVIEALTYTVLLGISFTCLQAFEYSHAAFGFKDGVYASNFYMATGFHGAHVIIGTIFLTVCLFRAKAGNLTKEGHLGFEFAAWYWHFVDVVWLFLFVSIYWFGS